MSFLLKTLVPLLCCIAALSAAFHHWRKYPILQEAINLKHPRWLALFVSCGAGVVGLGGAFALDHISKYFPRTGPPNMFDGPFDGLIIFMLAPLGIIAIFSSLIAAAFCLGHLISALISHLRSIQSKQS